MPVHFIRRFLANERLKMDINTKGHHFEPTAKQALVNRIDLVVNKVAKFDNVDKVDLDPQKNEVLISKGDGKGVIISNTGFTGTYEDELISAKISIDPESKAVKSADIRSNEYMPGSPDNVWYRSTPHYVKEEKVEQIGGEQKTVINYLLEEKDNLGEYTKTAKVDKKTGQIMDYIIRG
jgi:hypothetical protein